VDARLFSLLYASRELTRTRSGNSSSARTQFPNEVEEIGLLEAARRGDADAFAGLFDRYQRQIFRYAAHMCGRDAADDVVQETFLAVLRGTGRYDASRGPVVSYLLGIARHLVWKRLTSRELLALDDDWTEGTNVTGEGASSVLDSLTRAETVAAVRLAIQSLPPSYREAVVLCELQEMSYEAAAGIADCPVGTIRSRLHRAKALLMSKLAAVRPEAGSRR